MDHFSFITSDDKSTVYKNNDITKAFNKKAYVIPLLSGSQDFVFPLSLFTRLLENEMINYLKETFLILKPGGFMNMSFFSFDRMAKDGLLGGRYTFKHRNFNAYVENPKYPEAAVAYENDFLCSKRQEIGFSDIQIIKWLGQDIQCQK